MFNLLPSHCFLIIKSVPFQVSVLENERMHVAVRSILQLTVLALLGASCCLAGSYDFLSLNPPESPIIIKFFRRITILQHRIKYIFSFLSPGIKSFQQPVSMAYCLILYTNGCMLASQHKQINPCRIRRRPSLRFLTKGSTNVKRRNITNYNRSAS